MAGPWTTVAAAPVALTEVAVTAHDGRIWVAGGLRGDGSASDEVLVFDPVAATWASGPRLPEAVHHAALVSTGDGLVLVGGNLGNGTPTAAVRRLDDGAAGWTDEVPLPEASRSPASTWPRHRTGRAAPSSSADGSVASSAILQRST